MRLKKYKRKSQASEKKKLPPNLLLLSPQLYLKINNCSQKLPKCKTRMHCSELYSMMIKPCGLICYYIYKPYHMSFF